MAADLAQHRIGWIGTGRMGFPMAERLAKAGARISAYNRTRSKAEPLTKSGVTVVAKPADLAACDIVFTMVAAGMDLKHVTLGHDGVLAAGDAKPKLLVDCSTVDEEASLEVRQAAEKLGLAMLAAPVSGNGR
ncbi:MAG TPA: NAD(P)-binding domain-containing protein, partial [Stellaceae bacterium]|nr:NAD(P)-binding domain-containing protein [Stellaceae bacterium]